MLPFIPLHFLSTHFWQLVHCIELLPMPLLQTSHGHLTAFCITFCRSHTHTHTHTIILWLFWMLSRTTRVGWYQKGKITHTHTQPFYGCMEFVRDNPGEPVPEETFTQTSKKVNPISLCRSPLIITLVYPSIFTLMPLFSTLSFHSLSLLIRSSSGHLHTTTSMVKQL